MITGFRFFPLQGRGIMAQHRAVDCSAALAQMHYKKNPFHFIKQRKRPATTKRTVLSRILQNRHPGIPVGPNVYEPLKGSQTFLLSVSLVERAGLCASRHDATTRRAFFPTLPPLNLSVTPSLRHSFTPRSSDNRNGCRSFVPGVSQCPIQGTMVAVPNMYKYLNTPIF